PDRGRNAEVVGRAGHTDQKAGWHAGAPVVGRAGYYRAQADRRPDRRDGRTLSARGAGDERRDLGLGPRDRPRSVERSRTDPFRLYARGGRSLRALVEGAYPS